MKVGNKERLVMIVLSSVPGIGRRTLRKIIALREAGDLSFVEFWECRGQWERVGINSRQSESLKKFKKQFSPSSYIDYLQSKNIRPVTFEDKKYPEILLQIDDKPLILYIKGGELPDFEQAVSVVGSRNVTNYGERVTKKIVTELVGLGVTIVSGFMYGVDFLAHQTALEQGGKTVGVLGFGFDNIFPASFRAKFEQCLEAGMIFVSEYPPFVKSTKGTFPERNRIVAGLSMGTLVTEAKKDSGTMITSRLAGDYGRTVFAVPGSIFSPYSDGTKHLLYQGACLVSSGQEICDELDFTRSGMRKVSGEVMAPEGLDGLGRDVFEQLKLEPHDLNSLMKTTGKYVDQLSSALCMMELSGLVIKDGEVWKVRV